MLGIPVDAELEFAGDDHEATCRVVGLKPPKVVYQEEEMNLTVAAARVMGKDNTRGVQGPLWWRFEGETLVDRRKRMEAGE